MVPSRKAITCPSQTVTGRSEAGMVAQRGSQIANDGTRGANKMAELDKDKPVTVEELLVSTLAQGDALAKFLIEKGVITQQEFLQKIAEERATYQRLLKPTVQ